MTSRLIVPLDYPELPIALEIADRLCTVVDWFKIGKELFTSVGPSSVQSLNINTHGFEPEHYTVPIKCRATGS